jgi:hypothetical protein
LALAEDVKEGDNTIEERLMNLTKEQFDQAKSGRAVEISENGDEFVLIRKDVYEHVLKAVVYDDSEPSQDELRAIFARGIESSDWNDPAMDVYDDYDQHKP